MDDLELSWFKVIKIARQIFKKTVTDTMMESIEVEQKITEWTQSKWTTCSQVSVICKCMSEIYRLGYLLDLKIGGPKKHLFRQLRNLTANDNGLYLPNETRNIQIWRVRWKPRGLPYVGNFTHPL